MAALSQRMRAIGRTSRPMSFITIVGVRWRRMSADSSGGRRFAMMPSTFHFPASKEVGSPARPVRTSSVQGACSWVKRRIPRRICVCVG